MNTQADPTFDTFELDTRLKEAIAGLGFETPTPIQTEAIPLLLSGRDMIGGARTGSGKTAAFGLPLLERVKTGGKHVRALVLAPTRELALQVSQALNTYARKLPIEILTVYGGASYVTQLNGLKRGASVVVGTPGRVIDLMQRGALNLSHVEMFVLDEADEMLRMGFLEDVELVLKALPDQRQIALFSATMPDPIRRVAKSHLKDPAQIEVEDSALTTEHVEQRYIVLNHRDKRDALLRVLAGKSPGATLVFARTRKGCGEVAEHLIKSGISADALHGDLNQGARERVLGRLRGESLDVVVATDVAARGIDVEHLTHVINFDLPDDTEVYVHRIGRTARAGREGMAISFVTPKERRKMRNMQEELGVKIQEMPLPTDAQIADRRRGEITDLLRTELANPQVVDVRAWLRTVFESEGWSAEDVAAAAVHLLGSELGFEVAPAPQQERSFKPDTSSAKPTEGFEGVNEVELFLAIGRRDGLRPADVVGTLANDVGIPGSQIGRITLGGHKTFVGLPSKVATALMAAHKTITIRGKEVTLKLNATPTQTSRSRPHSKPTPDSKPKRRHSSKPPSYRKNRGKD